MLKFLAGALTDRYAVYAEIAGGNEKPLLQIDLCFARLLDDIVVL